MIVLDCDLDIDEKSTSALILTALAEAKRFRACENKFPSRLDEPTIISGSAANIHDDEEWIKKLAPLLLDAHQRSVPLLGICFGAEMLAKLLGGKVERLAEEEFGFVHVPLEQHALFAGLSSQLPVFQCHSYAIAAPPPGSRILSRSETGIQAFALGSTFGVQFHPEIDDEFAQALAERHGKDGALRHFDEENDPILVLRNFARLSSR